MTERRPPFGGSGRTGRLEVVWPPRTGPDDPMPKRYLRPLEPWESVREAVAGETALEDLTHRTSATAALIVLARYLTVRLVMHAAAGQWDRLAHAIEIDAAGRYLDRAPDRPDTRWLRRVITSIGPDGDVSPVTVSRLAAAASAAYRRDHHRGAFALWSAAFDIAATHRWHGQAARAARALARASAAAGDSRSPRLWSRRATVHELRARA